jgi:signal transduction histidine kinase
MGEIPPVELSWVNDRADRFEAAWRAGQRPRIEDFLEGVARPRRALLLGELLRVERELRRDGGEEPTPEEYQRRFPEDAAVVGDAFSLADVTDSSVSNVPGRVRETLTASIGPMPRVPLPVSDTDEASLPRSRPLRVQLFGEIARGGIGVVLKGHDPDLGRDVAVKVLLEKHRDRPQLVRRFIAEAQIGGQLQHPGVVPIYELGAFADRRPYIAMKLVKGRTLADLLRERPAPAADLPRFLAVFEAVAQTVAYAHARGVIHRDLKPSNVMVGEFGEVQVMDWGLAKVLPRDRAADNAADQPHEKMADGTADQPCGAGTVIATTRSAADTDRSVAGTVLGTPGYMAPEQARGDVGLIDERADVFALGSTLCEILTGKPAFTGPSPTAILLKTERADLADAHCRLNGCGADAELVALCRAALAADPDDRPRAAAVVAGRLTDHFAGVQERLRTAERARVEAEVKAAEEAKRREWMDSIISDIGTELRTSVAVVLGVVQLWKVNQSESATPTERDWVERIQNAGARLAGTVERMLKLARSNELSRPLDLQWTELEPLVRGMVTEMGPFLRARRQHLEAEIDPELGSADIDPGMVGDALANLLINAIKFTPDAGTIRVTAQPEGPNLVRFAVADSGVGIPPEALPYVFDPFFTGSDTMRQPSGRFEFRSRGIGLGLSMVKRFVELHGGSVEVASEPGAGATLAFTIPRRVGHDLEG